MRPALYLIGVLLLTFAPLVAALRSPPVSVHHARKVIIQTVDQPRTGIIVDDGAPF